MASTIAVAVVVTSRFILVVSCSTTPSQVEGQAKSQKERISFQAKYHYPHVAAHAATPSSESVNPLLKAEAEPITSNLKYLVPLSHGDVSTLVHTHNMLRNAVHGAADMLCLSWNSDLAVLAAEQAIHCNVLKKNNNIELRSRLKFNPVGQNLLTIPEGEVFTLADWVTGWFVEQAICEGNPDPSCSENYVQLIWAKTSQVGCAVANCTTGITGFSTGGYILVCKYSIGSEGTTAMPFEPGAACSRCPPLPTVSKCSHSEFRNLCCSKPAN